MIKDVTNISLIIIDVDGTLTDGGLYYDNYGNELKKFCAKDAVGFFSAHKVGIKTMILTGRECPAVTRRAGELKTDYLKQNIKNKFVFLENFIHEQQLRKEEIAYLGDDLNDLQAMKLAHYIGCPQDACEEVIKIADYKSQLKGGHGAVRDIIRKLLIDRGEWELVVRDLYDGGI